jgi:CRP/FNR family transcriptional regulator, nitrogen fixation regulation protein
MSVSLTVAAKHGHIGNVGATTAAYAPLPWNAPEERNGLELTGVTIHVAADHQIYAEGDEARCFYKVVSGLVRTCRFLSDGRRQIDAFHREGDVFGFEAGADHRMSAEAVSECTMIAYRRRGLETMVSEDDRLGRWFFAHAMNSMASAREHSLLLGRASAAQKIGAFLLEVADRDSSSGPIDLVMSRQDIADYLGLTIETVSRTLSQLERDAVIGLPSARRVMLKDRRTLRALNA